MKKNKMMRLASSLLVAVLLTTSVISGTFAKYTTSGNADDQARVAKFGVAVNVGADTAFTTEYDSNTVGVSGKTVISNANMDSIAGNDDVLAPGTEGILGTVKITGTPEVTVDVTANVDLSIAGWKYNDGVAPEEVYFPVVIKVNDIPVVYGINTSLADIESAVEAAVVKAITGNGTTETFVPNTLPTKDVKVTWAWLIETGSDPAEKIANNKKDTYLGNQASSGSAATITFSCEVLVEQVD